MTEATTPAAPATVPGAPDAPEVQTPAAPAAPAAPTEPTTIPVTAEDSGKGVFSYDPTGDSKLDMTLAFVGKHGFGPGHPAMVAAVNGDFSLLRAQMAEKGVPGADAYIALGEASYQSMHAENEKRRGADKEAVEKAVGGAEQWVAIQEWAGKEASEEEKGPLKEMLGKGGQHAIIAAGWLASQYQRATGGIPETEGAGPAAATGTTTSAATNGSLSPQAYAEAVQSARAQHKGREAFETSPAYNALRERRLRFKG